MKFGSAMLAPSLRKTCQHISPGRPTSLSPLASSLPSLVHSRYSQTMGNYVPSHCIPALGDACNLRDKMYNYRSPRPLTDNREDFPEISTKHNQSFHKQKVWSTHCIVHIVVQQKKYAAVFPPNTIN
jgi:hypothetical protein